MSHHTGHNLPTEDSKPASGDLEAQSRPQGGSTPGATSGGQTETDDHRDDDIPVTISHSDQSERLETDEQALYNFVESVVQAAQDNPAMGTKGATKSIVDEARRYSHHQTMDVTVDLARCLGILRGLGHPEEGFEKKYGIERLKGDPNV